MKRIITLIALLITVMSEQIKRERGWECRYDGRGVVQHCGYIN